MLDGGVRRGLDAGPVASAERVTVAAMSARRARRRRPAHVGWWGRLTLRAARLVLAGLAVVSLGAGMATTAWLVGPGVSGGQPPEAAGSAGPEVPGRPGAVTLGPLSILLPAGHGPWTAVSDEVFEPVRSGSASAGFAVEGAWGVLGPGGLVITVMTVAPGDHQGVVGLRGPFEGAAAVDVPWPGPGDHVAGWQETDGVRELLLAAELRDGRLVVLSLSGPVVAFADGELADAFATTVPVD